MNILSSATPVAFVYVKDRERALAFYCEKLDLALRSSDGFGDFIDLGGGLLRMTVMPDHGASPHPVLGWNVDDIAAAVRALRDRDVAFDIHEGLGQDELGIWTSPDGQSKVAFFSDPDGNALMLSQV
jgi:catechol 2,3-dioxygenase-like lactoylglutathione lyase family enzyme